MRRYENEVNDLKKKYSVAISEGRYREAKWYKSRLETLHREAKTPV
jgi:hypothetical protein